MKTKKSILIVDDEIGVRESLRQILKSHYEVYTAADGKEALEGMKKHNIDLVTLDLKMPGMSGIEVLREIKKIKEDIEVIIITAYGTSDNAGDAIYYGAGDFIVKPFNVADLTAKVTHSLERHKSSQGIRGLIQQIKELLPLKEDKKEEHLLILSKNLCEMLEKGEPFYPSGTEALNYSFKIAHSIRPALNSPPSEKN